MKDKGWVIGCVSLNAFNFVVFTILVLVFVYLFSGTSPAAEDTGEYGSSGGDLANSDALTAEQIKDLLTNKIDYGYNLSPYADQIKEASDKFKINPLFSLAIANKDSSLGTAGAGRQCRNPGNIEYRSDLYAKSGITALPEKCNNRWAHFETYGDGMQAKIWLLRALYLDEGYDSIEKIIARYCPASDGCDVPGYVADVKNFMEKYGSMYNS